MAAQSGRSQSGDSELASVDPIAMLIADHREASALFEQFDKIKLQEEVDDMKAAIVERICAALRVHTEIEERLFYPAIRDRIDDDDLLDEAQVEHDGAKRLIEILEDADPSDPLYDAQVTVLAEYIRHHVKEEETELFPEARRSEVDLDALGSRMAEMRVNLEQEYGLVDEADDEDEDDSEDEDAEKDDTSSRAKR